MNILALDTTGSVLSAALSSPDGTRHVEIDAGSRHSELLMELIDWLFKSAGLKKEELELVACMKGPGSFTGLRIAYAAAKGLSLALGIPMAAVPTLDCIAYPFSIWPGLAIPCIDAKKSCFYAALYRGGKRLTDYLDASPETLAEAIAGTHDETLLKEPIALCGPGAEMLFPLIARILEKPERLAIFPLFRRGNSLSLLELVQMNDILHYREREFSGPLYLRKSDAELSLNL
ncbi:tRNA (adenosine(37)-N6)-threonylcarbamoyltransferase complex dimerization subunit type 1 TsaB [Leadbettera azotonutricia]|uniref:Peptidase, M22 family n=1 Tax=Leadbettera azotonutricia (strain ATCC BAA-888 / DSM 13862 / ZAS-9) TaxID=545695 RepID=F5YDJ4_LEAAZ|nr:tRNA (adenosine(37)-N6)-threonylcarbamoyltransferase complex dimerization subunit type 1 TsaB [Leadbettera azotonutricia]AEF83460.1 peptidase, M22 family [Leadbettera azotonutricia ZAS-9]